MTIVLGKVDATERHLVMHANVMYVTSCRE